MWIPCMNYRKIQSNLTKRWVLTMPVTWMLLALSYIGLCKCSTQLWHNLLTCTHVILHSLTHTHRWFQLNTYNVTLRHVHVTIFAVEKQKVRNITCVWGGGEEYSALLILHANHTFHLLYYFHLWPTLLYNVFPHYLINSTIFGNKFIEH